MVWFGKTRDEEIAERISAEDWGDALPLILKELETRPKDRRLRLQLADTYKALGRRKEAFLTLWTLSDDLAADGHVTQALTVVKRLQALAPGRVEVEEKLARLMQEGQEAPPPEIPESLFPEDTAPEPRSQPVGEEPTKPFNFLTVMAATPLFRGLSRLELLEVVHGLTLRTCLPGEIIVTQGEPGGGLYVLTMGHVRVFRRLLDGRSIQIRELSEGDFFGEVSLLTGAPRSATVVAAARCELLQLDKETLDRIAARQPRVYEVIKDLFAERGGAAIPPSA